MKKTALILSSGRTGTQFMAHYFDANYDEVVALHEPPPARWLRFASHAHMRGSLSDDRIRALLAWKRRNYDDHLDTEFYIESNPFLSGFANVIADVWDSAVVIHVVRDPREHARSSLNHGTSSGLKGLANRLIPFWYPDVERILELDHEPSWIERTAGVWAIVNRLLCDAAPRFPRYLRVRYEDLFDDSHSGLRAVCEMLELPYRERDTTVAPGARMNESRLAALPDWRDWSPEQCLSLDRICAPLMREFGYGDEQEWRDRIAGERADD